MTPLLFVALAAFPTFDLQRACHGQEQALPVDQRANAYRTCMQSEQAAQAELGQRWAGFPAVAKRPCASLAPIFQSYVELLVCVEIRAGSG